ncbi:MAG: alpha/beta fold hydrolase [Rhodoglobus sp.]
MKKPLKVALIVVGCLLAIPVLGLGTTSIVNVVASNAEMADLTPYGELVSVDGKNMNVVIRGDGAETVVLLPGFATAAPALDFEPLIARLEEDYRVIAVEPFGYGLSDVAGTPRTTDNIVAEVHAALAALDVDRYVLMGHSIAGIYALDYIERFPDEVSAFVGIDSSVPGQPETDEVLPIADLKVMKDLGLLRLLQSGSPGEYDGLSDYNDEARKQLVALTNRNAYNADIASEATNIPITFTGAAGRTFPADLPVLLFVLDDPADPGWVQLHAEQVAALSNAEMVLLTGEHYLHRTESKAIAETFTEFVREKLLVGGAPAS